MDTAYDPAAAMRISYQFVLVRTWAQAERAQAELAHGEHERNWLVQVCKYDIGDELKYLRENTQVQAQSDM